MMASSTFLYQTAAKMNNEGVNTLIQGNHEAAIESMTNAIQLVKNNFTSGGGGGGGDGTSVHLSNKNEDIKTKKNSKVVNQPDYCNDSSTSVESGDHQYHHTVQSVSSQYHHHTTTNITTSSNTSNTSGVDTIEILNTMTTRESSDSTIVFNRAIRIPTMKKNNTCLNNKGTTTTTDSTNKATAGGGALIELYEMNICVSVIIFNLALVYHIKASSPIFLYQEELYHRMSTTTEKKKRIHPAVVKQQQEGINATTASNMSATITTKNKNNQEEAAGCLRKAKKLYSMAIKLLNGTSYLTDHTALVVKLACINNLSQILYSQGDYCYYNNSGSGRRINSNYNTLEVCLSQISQFLVQSSSPSTSYLVGSTQILPRIVEESQVIQDLLINALLFHEALTLVVAAAAA